MPDEYGRLSAADHDLIEGWWTQHSKEPVICPVCKTTDWKIAGHLINIPSHATATDANASDTSTYPHIVVICKFCAHSMFFNAANRYRRTTHSATQCWRSRLRLDGTEGHPWTYSELSGFN